MQDPLNAIRRLYDEPGAEDGPQQGMPAEAQAEARMLKAMKVGLDALPPQRPDAATIDAVLAAAGPDELDAVRALYGEGAAPGNETEAAVLGAVKRGLDALPRQRPDAATLAAVFAAADVDELAAVRAVYDEHSAPGDAAEVAILGAMKSGLDALPSRHPDAAVLDAVYAAAAATPHAPTRSADRAPLRLVTRRRMVVALGSAFALVLFFTSGLWLGQQPALPTVASVERQAPADESFADDVGERAEEEAAPELDIAANATAPASAGAEPTGSQDAIGSPAARAAPPAVRQRAPVAPPQARSAIPREADRSALVAQAEGDREASFSDAERVAEDVAASALASDEHLPLADGDEALQVLYLRMQEMKVAQEGMGWDAPPVALGAAPDSTPAASGWMQVRVER